MPGTLTAFDEEVPPTAGLAVAIAAISTGAILVRLSDAPSSVAAFYRVLFTTLPLLPLAAWRYRESFARIGRRDLAFATLSGVFLAVHFAAWFESLAWTSVAASVSNRLVWVSLPPADGTDCVPLLPRHTPGD